MPRNPLKTRCQVPGCRNWAMRGHTHCRPHRDPELGPRGAGAPPGNLNATRTGHDAHPLTPADLDQLVHDILGAPHQLPHHLDATTRSIYDRCHDPVKTLVALQALVPVLLSRVADNLFITELHAFLDHQPPARRGQLELSVWRQALRFGPVHKLELLRRLQRATGVPAPTATHSAPPPAPDRDEHDRP